MADERTRRSTNSAGAPLPNSAASKDGPRTVISKRPVPQAEHVPSLGNSVQELGQSLLGTQLGHFQLETFVGGGAAWSTKRVRLAVDNRGKDALAFAKYLKVPNFLVDIFTSRRPRRAENDERVGLLERCADCFPEVVRG